MRVMRRVLLLGTIATMAASSAWSAAASAEALEKGKTRALGDGYQLYWSGKELRVKKGKRSAALPVGDSVPSPGFGVEVKVAGEQVTLSHNPTGCEQSATLTRAQLEARLDVAQGEALLRGGKHAEAEARFVHAESLDGESIEASRGRARALLAQGKAEIASAVLNQMGNPLREYLHAAGDAKLAEVLRSAENGMLGQRRDAKPGTALLDQAQLTLPAPGIARSRFGDLVNVETSGGHGLCAYETRLVFRGGADLVEIASLPLVHSGDYPATPRGDEQCEEGKPPPRWARGAAVVARRVDFANRMLAELGFSPVPGDVGATPGRSASGAHTTRFGDIGLAIGEDGSARYFLKQRMLAEYGRGSVKAGQLVTAVLSVPHNRVYVVTKEIGCGREEHVWMGALPLPDRNAAVAPAAIQRR
jgi:hypothetical protein